MEAFEFTANCPNGCFLGIKPLVTTAVEALHILQHSPDIDYSTIYILYDDGMKLEKNVTDSSLKFLENGGTLEAVWAPTNDKQWGADVYIGATNGIVDSVSASPIAKTIGDFENVLGQPDKIRVYGFMPPDTSIGPDGTPLPIHYEICYSLYYFKWRALVTNPCSATINGPNPADGVDFVKLNAEFKDGEYMPWQGYGNMKRYMTPEVLRDYQQFVPGG